MLISILEFLKSHCYHYCYLFPGVLSPMKISRLLNTYQSKKRSLPVTIAFVSQKVLLFLVVTDMAPTWYKSGDLVVPIPFSSREIHINYENDILATWWYLYSLKKGAKWSSFQSRKNQPFSVNTACTYLGIIFND